jgi:putative membrane protein
MAVNCKRSQCRFGIRAKEVLMLIRSTAALAALFLLGAAPLAQAADKPTDPQIAHIAYTAGVLDVEAAKQALDLVKKLKVTPEDNDTSKALTKAASEERAKLAKLKGAAFDKAYVDMRLPTTSRWTARLRHC